MTYRLKAQESLPQGIKRIAKEQIQKAIAELSDTEGLGVDEAIHQARKRLKKIRAVLRLIRDQLGETSYKQKNIYFRDLGRTVANLRDSKVQIETLDRVTAYFADTIAPEAFTDIRRELTANYRQEYENVVNEGTIISLQQKLKDAENGIDDWIISSDHRLALDKSLKRVYKRGYKGLHRVQKEPSVENLHQWRKRVKYLRYQLRILRSVWSEMMTEWINQTHDLSDYLGEDHDLAMLKTMLLNQPEPFVYVALSPEDGDKSLEALVALIDRRREELQSTAIFLGRRIYTEKPKDFVDRLHHYWQIWQDETKEN